MGREGNLVTEIVDAKMLLTPDPRVCPRRIEKKILSAFAEMQLRESLPLPEEFHRDDRKALDDGVFEFLGYSDGGERAALLGQLYSELTGIYREIRSVEVEMQEFRRATARQDNASPHTIAEEIWVEFEKTQMRGFPADFVPDGELTESVALPAGKPKVVDDLFHRGGLQINGNIINLGSKTRAEFAAKVVELGYYGATLIPKSDRACGKALESYRRYEAQMEAKLSELAQERSADPDTQSRIVRELWKLILVS